MNLISSTMVAERALSDFGNEPIKIIYMIFQDSVNKGIINFVVTMNENISGTGHWNQEIQGFDRNGASVAGQRFMPSRLGCRIEWLGSRARHAG